MQTIEYDVFKKAQELAAAKYTTVIKRDTLSDGSYCYVAHNPELEGCTGQGETELEAANDLAKARLDYIYFLLADGLEVPEPIMPIDGCRNIKIQNMIAQKKTLLGK